MGGFHVIICTLIVHMDGFYVIICMLIVRMGAFHMIMCMLRTIYSRFKDSAIVETLVEAGVGANQNIRYFEIFYEALLRSKIDFLNTLSSKIILILSLMNILITYAQILP